MFFMPGLLSLCTASVAAPADHSAHIQHTLHRPIELPGPLPAHAPSSGEHHSTVYAYVYGGPYAIDRVDFDSVTHVAWHRFNIDAYGNVEDLKGWTTHYAEFIEAAHAEGVKVHLTVMPYYEGDGVTLATMQSALLNPTYRANMVEQLAAYVNDYGADGINIDFEGLTSATFTELADFTAELKAEVDEVYLSTPTVDWHGGYDYDELAFASDGLVIMGYDHHGYSSNPGPVSIFDDGDGLWPYWDIQWALEDYQTWGAPNDKIVMALPLYGRKWNAWSDDVPGTRTDVLCGSAECAPSWNVCRDSIFPTYERNYEPRSETPWVWTGTQQIWCDDMESMTIKLEWVMSQAIQGFGFWEVGYAAGDGDLWTLVDELAIDTTSDSDADADADTDADVDADADADDTGDLDDTGDTDDSGEVLVDFEGDAPGECKDGADNDRDGDFDCDDTDCAGAPACEDIDDDSREKGSGGCSISPAQPEGLIALLLVGLIGVARRQE